MKRLLNEITIDEPSEARVENGDLFVGKYRVFTSDQNTEYYEVWKLLVAGDGMVIDDVTIDAVIPYMSLLLQ